MTGDSSPAAPPVDTTVSSDREYSTRLLEMLFTKQHRKFQPVASLILGLAGVALFAIAVSSWAGELFALSYDLPTRANPTLAISVRLLICAAVYPAVVITLQLLATCRLPLSARLLLVIALLLVCLRAFAWGARSLLDMKIVLICLPICCGGFIQRWRFGWSAIAWDQKTKPAGKLSIAMLLDWTAAFAVVLAFFSSLETKPLSLLSMIPVFLIMAVGGMHVWGRLTALCDQQRDQEIGFVMWMIGNTIFGCLIFMFVAFSGPRSPVALISFVVAPASVLIAQLATVVPIAWLRACGWKLVHVKYLADTSSRGDVQFLDLSVQGQRVVDKTHPKQSAGAQK